MIFEGNILGKSSLIIKQVIIMKILMKTYKAKEDFSAVGEYEIF
jgi:hypothetical protein